MPKQGKHRMGKADQKSKNAYERRARKVRKATRKWRKKGES